MPTSHSSGRPLQPGNHAALWELDGRWRWRPSRTCRERSRKGRSGSPWTRARRSGCRNIARRSGSVPPARTARPKMPVTSKIRPWKQVQGIGRMGDDQPQMPPAVAERPQVRRAAALVRIELGRDLADVEPGALRVDHHFRGKFHAGRARAHLLECVAGETPHAAMEVADRRTVRPAGNGREDRIAEILVKRRHGARLNPASEAVAHNQVGAIFQSIDEGVELDSSRRNRRRPP